MPPAATAPRPASLSLLSLTTPVAMGYIPLGAVFGFLFVQAGGAGWLAVLASIVVYAGAAQYMMVPMVAAGLPVGAIALATLILNLRHAFYGLSLLERVPTQPWLRWTLVFCLTDETYSVLTALPPQTPPRQMALLALLNQGWWVLGTAVGAAIGAQAQLQLAGLDFVLAALFAVLLVEQWRRRSSAAPLWVALGGYALGHWWVPSQALLIGIALSVVAGLLWPTPSNTREGQA